MLRDRSVTFPVGETMKNTAGECHSGGAHVVPQERQSAIQKRGKLLRFSPFLYCRLTVI